MLCPVASLLPCASCFVVGFAMGWAASAVVACECWAARHLARPRCHLVAAFGVRYANDRFGEDFDDPSCCVDVGGEFGAGWHEHGGEH